MINYFYKKRDLLHHHFGKFYFKYGCFCSTHPILMIAISCTVVILCSLPLSSFPIFERIIAFMFQRIRVNYITKISPLDGQNPIHQNEVFGYVQQINVNATIHGHTILSKEEIVDNILSTNSLLMLDKKLREPAEDWNTACMKLHRDPPSMKALKKRMKFSHSSFHHDLKQRRFYLLECLYVSPNLLYDNGRSIGLDEYSVGFQELILGYPIQYFKGDLTDNPTQHISIVFTLFLKDNYQTFKENLETNLTSFGLKNADSAEKKQAYKIKYNFSDDSGPAELLPLGLAYLVVFLYLWFSVAKFDFIRTRWGLAFAAVMNFVFSFIMAIGVCAYFDALPTNLNVGEIFPYVVILIGIENFWIITKSVMTTKKDLSVKERLGIGLGLEGWYITKNLLVEISLLGFGYISGVKGVQEFSIFALACYLSDFFLQLAFFTPILAVDIRRAEVGLPFSNRSAWKYALYIDLEKPKGSKNTTEEPTQHGAAVRMAFGLARYRVLQRSVMVFIIMYFVFIIYHPFHELVNPGPMDLNKLNLNNRDGASQYMSCLTEQDVASHKGPIPSWLFLCNKHWPELFNYYFQHLNNKSLVILPELKVSTTLNAEDLVPHIHEPNNWSTWLITFMYETSKPIIAVCAIIVFAVAYKAVNVIQMLLKELNTDNDLYTCETHALKVPTSKQFPFKVTKLIVDEQDILVTAYVNGSVYVWDLYSNSCQYYINRRVRRVYNMAISRSTSFHSLPTPEDAHTKKKEQSQQKLPRAVWSIAYKSDVLVVGCNKGSVEVYSLESECLQCYHQSNNESGVVSVQIISCLRFVIAHKSGIVEFCHIKNARGSRKRANSLPNEESTGQVVEREMEISRVVVVSNQPIISMEIALNKVFVASDQGLVKVLRARDDGGIPLQCHIPRDQEITFLRTEESPEMALIGTSTGTVYVVNAVGQLEKMLNCSEDEVMSITSDDDYIAVHCYDGCTTVWLKEGYIKWWNINMLTYGAVHEILSLSRYCLAAITKESVILLSLVTRSVVGCYRYNDVPNYGLIMSSPVVCQNKSSVAIPSANTIYHVKFPKLIDHDR